MRANTLKKFNQRVHWEPRTGSQNKAIEHCKKGGDFQEYGEKATEGKREVHAICAAVHAAEVVKMDDATVRSVLRKSAALALSAAVHAGAAGLMLHPHGRIRSAQDCLELEASVSGAARRINMHNRRAERRAAVQGVLESTPRRTSDPGRSSRARQAAGEEEKGSPLAQGGRRCRSRSRSQPSPGEWRDVRAVAKHV